MKHNLLPVPIMYVFVPCKVNDPGLHPSTLMTRLDSCSMAGINDKDVAIF